MRKCVIDEHGDLHILNIEATVTAAPMTFVVDGRELFSIGADGCITFGPAFTTVDEASLAFWRWVAENGPKHLGQARNA